jgi:hypothetical protein
LGLGALVKIHVSCCNRGGWLRIAGVGVRIKNVLVITRLIFLFETFDTVEQALSGEESKRPAAHYPATSGIAQPIGSSYVRDEPRP